MHYISNSLCLDTKIVIKERFSSRRRGSDCNIVDVRGCCMISCRIRIRIFSNRDRIHNIPRMKGKQPYVHWPNLSESSRSGWPGNTRPNSSPRKIVIVDQEAIVRLLGSCAAAMANRFCARDDEMDNM